MSFDMDNFLKKTEEFKNQIDQVEVQMAGLVFIQTKESINRTGQKIVFETGNNGLEIECKASRAVAMIGIYELMNNMGLKKCLNMLAVIHGLKQTAAIDTIVKDGNLSSREELEVMKELLNKSPEEIEKLKEQLDV